jgi:hypothetical protein
VFGHISPILWLDIAEILQQPKSSASQKRAQMLAKGLLRSTLDEIEALTDSGWPTRLLIPFTHLMHIRRYRPRCSRIKNRKSVTWPSSSGRTILGGDQTDSAVRQHPQRDHPSCHPSCSPQQGQLLQGRRLFRGHTAEEAYGHHGVRWALRLFGRLFSTSEGPGKPPSLCDRRPDRGGQYRSNSRHLPECFRQELDQRSSLIRLLVAAPM